MTILVTAASRHGATYEIAQAIGRVLEGNDLETQVRRVDEVQSVATYDAVVAGSAVYLGRWLSSARAFVGNQSDELRKRPAWLFSSGPVGRPPRPRAEAAVQVDDLIAASGAREHRLFSGRLDKAGLGLGERAVVFAFRSEEGDFRDWDEIAAWATGIADALNGGACPALGPPPFAAELVDRASG